MATLAAEWVQQGIEQGIQQGIREGRAIQTAHFLQRRFGLLAENLNRRIQVLSIEALERLGDDSFDFQSVAELAAWLDRNAGDAGLKH